MTHNSAVEASLRPLLPLYERERAAARAFALAIVVHTSGSTYRKPGALMAIAADGSYAGLLSGGCLEADLAAHARAVIDSGELRTVTYNTGGSDDALWGLGIGCEGAMQIALIRVGPQNGWEPVASFARALEHHTAAAMGLVVESTTSALAAGRLFMSDAPAEALAPAVTQELATVLARSAGSGRAEWLESGGLRIFAVPLALPPRLLLLGAGPDAQPLVEFAARLGWRVTVYDHRPAYARPEHFPGADRVVLAPTDEVAQQLDPNGFEAAVIMSHHLSADLAYLKALSTSRIAYVGLLGPGQRRERLLAELGDGRQGLRGRLRSPVGLDLGGRSPESVALAIIAGIQAHLHGRSGGPFPA